MLLNFICRKSYTYQNMTDQMLHLVKKISRQHLNRRKTLGLDRE